MATKGIITAATDTITGAARTGVEAANSAANRMAKVATGAALTAVRGARRLVAVKKPRRRRKPAARKAKKTARRKILARGRARRKQTAKRRAR